MADLFNVNMSSFDAQYAFFKQIDGKSKEEVERIKDRYFKVIEAIDERELKLAHQGWFL